MKITAAAIAFLVAGALAAPTGDGLKCAKRASGKLKQQSLKTGETQLLGYSTAHGDASGYTSLMRPRRDVDQIFTFYNCDAPSNEYDSNERGQLVSNDEGLCVSISKIDLRNADEGYNAENGELRLEPCKKPGEAGFARQWFHVFDNGQVMHVGKKDMGARAHVADTDVVALRPGPSVAVPDIIVLDKQ